MRALIKIMLILVAIFVTIFIFGRVLGILTLENIRFILTEAAKVEIAYLVMVVIILLFADIILSIPTLTVIILAGYFLGFPLAVLSSYIGMASALFTAYFISRKWGERAIAWVVKDEAERADMRDTFSRNGPAMILLSRAAPMVPEVCACLAGATGMKLGRYMLFFTLSTLPYACIAAYAGSISSVDDPKPAIFAMLFLYALLWGGWAWFRRYKITIS